METKPPMPFTVPHVQWIDFPPNPRRRMNVLGYADAELIPYQLIRVPVPQVTEFGRALDRERITEPTVRRHRRPWRLALIVVAGAAALVAAPWVIAGVLRWMGVGL